MDPADIMPSDTTTAIKWVPTCDTCGVHKKSPAPSSLLIVAPGGASTRVYVRVLAGRSGSWPTTEKAKVEFAHIL